MAALVHDSWRVHVNNFCANLHVRNNDKFAVYH